MVVVESAMTHALRCRRLTTREEGRTRGQCGSAAEAYWRVPVMMQAALATAFAAVALVVRSVGRLVGRPVLGPY